MGNVPKQGALRRRVDASLFLSAWTGVKGLDMTSGCGGDDPTDAP